METREGHGDRFLVQLVKVSMKGSSAEGDLSAGLFFVINPNQVDF